MRHINFFLGAQNGGVLGGGQKVYVEKVYVRFHPLCPPGKASVFQPSVWLDGFLHKSGHPLLKKDTSKRSSQMSSDLL